jgi:beta-glucosidase
MSMDKLPVETPVTKETDVPSHRRASRRRFLASTLTTTAALAAGSVTSAATPQTPSRKPRTSQKPAGTTFPAGFQWGAATAAYQIEGAMDADGKGQSIWDMFVRKPNAIWRGHTGDVACDHYRRYKEDVSLMKKLGLRAYRFSLAWARILPEGTGTVNVRGLDFYDRLVDELLAAGITPFCTLYHWDLPLALHQRGGWTNRDSANWFAEYTTVAARRLGDRITYWMTLNEPQVFITLGYQVGRHAPGLVLPLKDVLQAGHHALLAHGKGVQALRAHVKQARIGFAPATPIAYPATEQPEDIAAARAFNFGIQGYGFLFNASVGLPLKNPFNNAWWMDPVFLGEYPAEGLALYKADAPQVADGDMAIISTPVDFCGVNIYFGFKIQSDGRGGPRVVIPTPATPLTAFDWPVTPEALRWGPKFFHERYKRPIYITENGLALRDWVALDGKVHDPQRIDFTTRYLRELRRAVGEGVPVQGYFHWSILDNFEWAEGYKQRFGLVYVDYDTQVRTPKDSFAWYAQVIATNGAALG